MKVEELLVELCSHLQREYILPSLSRTHSTFFIACSQLTGAMAIARRIAEFLRTVVLHSRYPDPLTLLAEVKKIGIQLQQAKPSELVIGNVIRRVLHLIREERAEEMKEDISKKTDSKKEGENIFLFSRSLHSLLDLATPLDEASKQRDDLLSLSGKGARDGSRDPAEKSRKTKTWKGRQGVIDGINEFIEELENIPLQIAQHGLNQIHANEVVLTFGYSETVLQFLRLACEKRPEIKVVVAEASPGLEGHKMARALSEMKIKTTVIPDAAIFAIMARVDQVFLGCYEILADGGMIGQSGISLIASAANHHSVPLVVLVGTHKLSPLFPQNPSLTLNVFNSSHEIAQYEDFSKFAERGAIVLNPSRDFVPPQSISLVLTDHGGVMPSYIYRLLTEFYSKEDYVLTESW